MTKADVSHVEPKKMETQMPESLGAEHREYLIQLHGTAELIPTPSHDSADPLNWSTSKKLINLALVSFHAFMATFTASAIQSAFVNIAEDLHVSVHHASYLTSLVIAILGGAPLFWRPLTNTYGRQPIFLITLLCSLVGNIGCAVSHSYATTCLCRAITAFFISPAASIGSGVVMDMFFKAQRGKYMGIWTSMVTLGVPLAPLIFGFLAVRVSYRWIYWILAIVNGVQFLLYLLVGSETRYIASSSPSEKPSGYASRIIHFRRIDPTPLTLGAFLHPLALAVRPCVAIPGAAYAMVFLFGSIMITIEIPLIFPEQFGFSTQQVGLQFISVIVGTILGEQVGGYMSDRWMTLGVQKHRDGGDGQVEGRPRQPEHRLWISWIGYLLTICGVVVFCVQLDKAKTWNMTPVIGAAIAAAGNQIVTTILITYAVESHKTDAAAVGVFILLVRQTWGFIGPFWFPDLITEIGLPKSAAVFCAMMVAVSMIPTALLQWKGSKWSD